MNQTAIGSYIARKRKEQNLTQEQLAQQLGVSNKTISKWENGKCMPDYSIIEPLCDALHVTLPELMDGEDAAEDSMRVYDDEQILDLLRRTQELERQKRRPLWLCPHRPRHRQRCHVQNNRRNGCTGLLLRYPDGAFCCGDSCRSLCRRESAPEAVKNTVFFESIIRFKEGGTFILFIASAHPPAQAATPGACASWLVSRRCSCRDRA